MKRRGLLFVLSSPSGAGKSTIARMLLASEPELSLSVSATTRAIRRGEEDGRDYHFVSLERFREMASNHEFLEWAHVFDQRYGTPRAPVDAMLGDGKDVLFDIDWQGAEQVRGKAGADVVTVFVLPPSAEELRARLERRAEDAPEVIARRLRNAAVEIGHWEEYDYVVVNDDLDRCFNEIRSILEAERLRRVRRPAIGAFAEGLVESLGSTLI